jgi:hypothetical protein
VVALLLVVMELVKLAVRTKRPDAHAAAPARMMSNRDGLSEHRN